jgi:hypothetical protein
MMQRLKGHYHEKSEDAVLAGENQRSLFEVEGNAFFSYQETVLC